MLNFDIYLKKNSDLFFEKIKIQVKNIKKLLLPNVHTNISMTSTICIYKVFSTNQKKSDQKKSE